MFIFKVFAAIVLASATTAYGARQTNATQENSTSCNGVDVPRSKFIGVNWTILSTNIPPEYGLECETLKISSKRIHGQRTIYDKNTQGSVDFPWTHYSNGCLTYLNGPGIPASTLTFKSFSDESLYKTAVFFITNPMLNSSEITIATVASVNNIPPAKLDALQQEAIAGEPSLSNTTFYRMPQSNCTYQKSG